MTSCPSSVTAYLQHMSLSSHTSLKAATGTRNPPWPVALLAPAARSPQEAAACPLLMFYQPCLLLSIAVLEHSELLIFLLEHYVLSIICYTHFILIHSELSNLLIQHSKL
jgi:hypothetical protein